MVNEDQRLRELEDKEKKLRELEEQLAREREILENLKYSTYESDPVEIRGSSGSDPGAGDIELNTDQGNIHRYSDDRKGVLETIELEPLDDPVNSTHDKASINDIDESDTSFGFKEPPDDEPMDLDFELDPIASKDGPAVRSSAETTTSSSSTESSTTPLSEIDEYRRDITDFRKRGYNVSRLYGIFEEDLDSIRKNVLSYMEDITKLKELEQALETLDTSGYDHEVSYLQTLLKNPDAVNEAGLFLEDLKNKLKHREDSERETKIQEIDTMFDGLLKEYSEEISRFKNDVEEIKASIIDMDTAPLSDFIHLKKTIWELKDALVNERKKMDEEKELMGIANELKEWKLKGFDVTEIETVLKKYPEDIDEVFDEFKANAHKLMNFDRELKKMNTKGFETEVREIKKCLRDTKRVIDVMNKLESLKRRIRLNNMQKTMGKIKTTDTPAARIGPTQMTCPKCKGVVSIPSDERPLKVRCSSCETEYNLKRIPSSGGKPGPSAARMPTTPTGQPPIQGPPVQGGHVTPGAPGSQIPSPGVTPGPTPAGTPSGTNVPPPPIPASNKCPTCGEELIPDSLFCGICGFKV